MTKLLLPNSILCGTENYRLTPPPPPRKPEPVDYGYLKPQYDNFLQIGNLTEEQKEHALLKLIEEAVRERKH